MAAPLDELLVTAERTLSRTGVAHALIGGCARNVYASPRATRDVDLAVEATAAQYAAISAELRAQGFTRVTETKSETSAALPDVALFSDDSGGRIDLVLAHTDFERQAISRAQRLDFAVAGISVPVVQVEDLIVYKALAARPRDLLDIEDIARAQTQAGATIDWAHIEHACAEWDARDLISAIRKRVSRQP